MARHRKSRKVIWRRLKLGIALGLPLLVYLLPPPLAGLSELEHRVVALFVFAALFWVLEPIPIYATSLLIIVLELIWLSDSALLPFRQGEGLDRLMSYREIMAVFGSPILLLFLGGFFLALAASKYRLDVNLAQILLRPMGRRPTRVMLGLMGITALLSMFMSNTATTAMVLSILLPILQRIPASDPGRVALALSVPTAANIGGIGTPIGTPPNAIALEYLAGPDAIGFGHWMALALPFALVLLLLGWWLLCRWFPFGVQAIELDGKVAFARNPRARILYITFAATVVLWLTDFLHGMNTYTVAMIPVAVFLATGVINKEDLKKLSWDVLWLVAGGIALGLALERSGLAQSLVEAIPFAHYPSTLILLFGAVFAAVMANFMSNTATANLLLPLIAALAAALPGLEAVGGNQGLIVGIALACSLGMALPISTPPNALAHATGELKTAQMARLGLVLGLVGLVLILGWMSLLAALEWVK